MQRDPDNLWIWRHLRLSLPASWEMLQFSRRPDLGRCLFADRHDYRLEFSWRQVDGEPDFDRMLHDYEQKLVADHGMTDCRRLSHGPWRGLVGNHGERTVSRFGRYVARESCLVELVLPWPNRRQPAAEQHLLDSVSEEPPVDGQRRWCAFGLDCRAHGDLAFTTCDVKPGSALLTFAPPRGRSLHLAHFSRLGLVGHWLKGGVETWLQSKVPERSREIRQQHDGHGDHRIASVTAKLSSRFPHLLSRGFGYYGCAWLCPADGRLYHAALIQREAPTRPLAGWHLSCCPSLATAGGAA